MQSKNCNNKLRAQNANLEHGEGVFYLEPLDQVSTTGCDGIRTVLLLKKDVSKHNCKRKLISRSQEVDFHIISASIFKDHFVADSL